MRLKSHLIGIASAAALAFAGANALAQGAPSPQADKEVSKSGQAGGSLSTQPTTKGAGAGAEIGGSTAKSAGANAPSLGPWTADNVTAARPFGEINIMAAGTTTQSISTWAGQRTPAERAELSGRCESSPTRKIPRAIWPMHCGSAAAT